jgi:hypothetical protein
MTTALVLAAAAVAYLLWSRPAAPAGLPPLSPLPAPLVPPAAPAAAGGLSTLQIVTLAMNVATIAVCFMAFSLLWNRDNPAPAPGPAPVVGLDLRGLFRGEEASRDATTTAALLEELASQIEWDGSQTEPRLKTGAAFDDLRRAARELRTRGVSLGARQPAVRDAIKTFLDSEAGTEGGPVDAAARAKWVKAYRAVSAAAAEATR